MTQRIILLLTIFSTVSSVATAQFSFTTLASFTDPGNAGPAAGLVMDAQGNLFGTTIGVGLPFFDGSPSSDGSVFELPSGSNTILTLATFNLAGDNGSAPQSSLIIDRTGNLFGMTPAGGHDSFGGTVFRVDGATHELTDIVQTGRMGQTAAPAGSPLFDAQGNLFVGPIQIRPPKKLFQFAFCGFPPHPQQRFFRPAHRSTRLATHLAFVSDSSAISYVCIAHATRLDAGDPTTTPGPAPQLP